MEELRTLMKIPSRGPRKDEHIIVVEDPEKVIRKASKHTLGDLEGFTLEVMQQRTVNIGSQTRLALLYWYITKGPKCPYVLGMVLEYNFRVGHFRFVHCNLGNINSVPLPQECRGHNIPYCKQQLHYETFTFYLVD
jgi:hypothetical protein